MHELMVKDLPVGARLTVSPCAARLVIPAHLLKTIGGVRYVPRRNSTGWENFHYFIPREGAHRLADLKHYECNRALHPFWWKTVKASFETQGFGEPPAIHFIMVRFLMENQ